MVARQQVENGAQVIDVNMDEGLLDSEQAMVTFLNLIAAEPDIARVPVMVDSSKWTRDRGRAEVPAGQGHRQLDLDEGRRGRVPAPGAAGAALRRGGGGDGLRRGGPGRHRAAQGRDLRARLPAADRGGRLPARGHHLRPEHASPSPPASRSTTTTRSTSSRPRASCKRRFPYSHVSGGVSNVSFSLPRQRAGARRRSTSVFLYHAIRAGMDMGIVNAGALPLYDELDPRAARAGRGRGAQPPRATPPSACWRSPTASRARRARRRSRTCAWREQPVRRAALRMRW